MAIPQYGEGNSTPLQYSCLGKSHAWRSLAGCSPWGHPELDMTERLHFHFSLSCIGEGNGNPLQCSCLENPRDGGAWWAAVYGVAQSRTRLKRLSSSSSIPQYKIKFKEIPTLSEFFPLIERVEMAAFKHKKQIYLCWRGHFSIIFELKLRYSYLRGQMYKEVLKRVEVLILIYVP